MFRAIGAMLCVGVSLLSLIGCGNQTESSSKVIYGNDDRFDLVQVANSDAMKRLAKSTVLLAPHTEVEEVADRSGLTGIPSYARSTEKMFKLKSTEFGSTYNLCQDEPFRTQPIVGFCSGFLVAPDLVVTAGHCMAEATRCAETSFVFDYSVDEAGHDATVVPESSVYRCAEVVAQAYSQFERSSDFAVVRLDRAVTGHQPLRIRRSGAIAAGDAITVIGHPTTLPTKIAGGANVRDVSPDKYFFANLDTYGGNSGSAVFNNQTGAVEGILVRGENDFIQDASGCTKSNRCANDGCAGEEVNRIADVLSHVPSQE